MWGLRACVWHWLLMRSLRANNRRVCVAQGQGRTLYLLVSSPLTILHVSARACCLSKDSEAEWPMPGTFARLD